jgi:hypothetical protein
MHRCSNPLCVGEISLTSSYIRVDGRLFCGTACANSWVIANTALQGAAIRFSPKAFDSAAHREPSYRTTGM